jgi:hypothetical protein
MWRRRQRSSNVSRDRPQKPFSYSPRNGLASANRLRAVRVVPPRLLFLIVSRRQPRRRRERVRSTQLGEKEKSISCAWA